MSSSSGLTEAILRKAASLGASVAGIASVESLKTSPSHRILARIGMNLNEHCYDRGQGIHAVRISWPGDAVSAVVIGIEHTVEKPELDWWDGSGTPGNRILIRINDELAGWIEKTYRIRAYKLPYFIEKGGIFLKDAAVNAGLGSLGKNNLVITPQYGPRIRFRALLLNKEAQSTGPRAFNPCRDCGQPCRTSCPMDAFRRVVYAPDSLGPSFLPGTDGRYDRVTCNMKMAKDIDDAARTMTSNVEKQLEIRRLINQFEKSHSEVSDQYPSFNYCVRYCRECELSCPVGME